MNCQRLQITECNWWYGLPQRDECFHIRFEHGSLSPRPKGLVDMSVNTSRCDVTDQICCGTAKSIHKKCREYPCPAAWNFCCVLVRCRSSQNCHALVNLGNTLSCWS